MSCEHKRQKHTQVYVVMGSDRLKSTRYCACKDFDAYWIATWPAAFQTDKHRRTSRIERNDP
jgi:hypothetical protein